MWSLLSLACGDHEVSSYETNNVIRIEELHLAVGEFRLGPVSFDVPTGKYALLMGKTGSGKTSLLEAIAGLKPVSRGRIVLGDLDVTALKPAERNIGYVPQDGALFIGMRIRDQIGFALRVRRVDRATISKRVEELAALLDIGHLLDRTAHGLSGGERQRVALGRALAFKPTTLCLDEPLSAVDQATHSQIVALLRRVNRETGVTCLHVTHNLHEAEALADVRLEIADGRVQPSEENVVESDQE